MLIIRLALITSTLTLSACAQPPKFLANFYDAQDRCQNYYKVENYKSPDYCGASSGRAYIYNNGSVRQGYIKK
jgi:hypothetical protein